MDLNDRLGACGMSKLPITNAMIAKQGQEVKGILLEKDRENAFLAAQERKTLNVSREHLPLRIAPQLVCRSLGAAPQFLPCAVCFILTLQSYCQTP